MVLFYITAEDVFGQPLPGKRGPRPLHTIPATVSGLYDLGMRHHVRSSVLSREQGAGFEAMPDGQLDRLVIRVALYGRENLAPEPGRRVATNGLRFALEPEFAYQAREAGLEMV